MTDPAHSAAGGSPPLWIGVTGNIACGKSTVVGILRAAGAETIDADEVYASLVTPGAPLLRAIAQRFGAAIVAPDGSLDRRALANIVFTDPAALADLDRIVRPPVVTEVLRRAERARSRVVVIDAIKLIESGLADRCDEVWVVTCGPEQQVERLMARNRLERESAERRIAAQAPVAEKLAHAERVVDNDGDLDATRRQVEDALAAALAQHGRANKDGRFRRMTALLGRKG